MCGFCDGPGMKSSSLDPQFVEKLCNPVIKLYFFSQSRFVTQSADSAHSGPQEHVDEYGGANSDSKSCSRHQ